MMMLREGNRRGRKGGAGSLVPWEGRCLPALVVLVSFATALQLDARPRPEVLECPYAKQMANKTEVKVDSFFRLSFTGMILWFSAFKKILVPIGFIDINYCKSDSFSAY